MEKTSGIDLSQFRLWYTQSGTPSIQAESDFKDGVLSLVMTQTCPPTPGQPEKEPFLIPIKVALFSDDGKKAHEQTLSMTKAIQTFKFDDLSAQPAISILRDFSAPVKLSVQRDSQMLRTLIRHDDNGFARWEAMQELCLSLILPAIKLGKLNDDDYQNLLTVFKELIISQPEDKAIFAEMLTLPSASYIAELVEEVDPQLIASIRKKLVTRLARDLESQFHLLYATHNQAKSFSLSAEAIADRALKNRALSYLVASDQAAYHALASHQYHQANNMTDRLAAFTALTHSSYPESKLLVQDFYEEWQNNALVLDKWLAIQATQPTAQALDEVFALCSHQSFSINNPNKVRALIGAFCSNLVGFHQENGAGYKFVADKIIELNQVNPQVAARLAGTFNKWRSFTQPYQGLMQAELNRISDEKGLTKDVMEIVTKALNNH